MHNTLPKSPLHVTRFSVTLLVADVVVVYMQMTDTHA